MPKVKTTVNAGVCGFVTEIIADSEDYQTVTFVVESPCAKVQAGAAELGPVDAYQELGAGFSGAVCAAFKGSSPGCCCGCLVPAAALKAMQIAASLALPTEAGMTFEKL